MVVNGGAWRHPAQTCSGLQTPGCSRALGPLPARSVARRRLIFIHRGDQSCHDVLYVLLFIAHDRRELLHVNVTTHPTAACVWRQLIDATAWGRQPRLLVRDRDRVYGGDFVPRPSGWGSRRGSRRSARRGRMPSRVE
jgi:hypothetical protein